MKKLRNEKGFMSIEAVMSIGILLMVFLLGIGFFAYMIPKQNIQEEVRLLGKMVKLEGGITSTVDVDGFKNRLVEKGYASEESEITVKLYKESSDGKISERLCENLDVCSERVERGELYGSSFAVLRLEVEVPANKQSVLNPLSFFSVDKDKLSDKYVFSERVMSEYVGDGGL